MPGSTPPSTCDRAVVGLGLLEEWIFLELLLDERRQLEMRELQQLDRLLQLRRHCQRLARSQDETRTDTHVPLPLEALHLPQER